MSDHSEECDVLALSPHPDDADLFCGATLASWAAQGRRVRIVDLTAGELSTNGTVQLRRQESLAAAAALGVDSEREVLGLEDGGLDHRDPAQVERLVELLRRRRPRLLVAPWRDDRHPDHLEASLLARDALFWAGVAKYAPRAGEAARPRRLIYYPCHAEAPADLYINVGAGIESWEKSLDCYASQVQSGPDRAKTFLNRREFRSGLRARRRHWGELCGVVWAEAFLVEGSVAWTPSSLLDAIDMEAGE